MRKADRRHPHRPPRPSRASTSTRGRTTRPRPASRPRSSASHGDDGALTVIDATSAAGGIDFSRRPRPTSTTSHRRRTSARTAACGSPLVSPAAIERIERIAASGRYIPEFLSLKNALDNSRLNQTLNTPALATLFLLDEQLEWITTTAACSGPTPAPASPRSALYEWAEASAFATPVRRRPRRPLARRRHDRLRRLGRCRGDRQEPARQRHRRHRAVPQARPQPAARRDLRLDRARTTCVSSSAASTTRRRSTLPRVA